MLVKHWMSKPVVTIEATDTIKKAKDLLSKHRIRSMPVMSDEKLVGIVTDRDLKQASVTQSTSMEAPEVAYLNTRIPVDSLMTEDVISVHPDTTVVEVAKILLDKKISGTPVLDESGNVVGMITQGDIFKLLISLTGFETKGLQVAVQISTETGTVKEVANAIRAVGGRINTLLTSYEGVPDGYRNAFLKVYDVEESRIEEMIEILKTKSTVRYVLEYHGDDQPSKMWVMNV